MFDDCVSVGLGGYVVVVDMGASGVGCVAAVFIDIIIAHAAVVVGNVASVSDAEDAGVDCCVVD